MEKKSLNKSQRFVPKKEEVNVNKNCMLARNGFFPYQRCDYCSLKVTKCTGIQYNVLVLFISILLMMFLFFYNPFFIRFNIIAIIFAVIIMGYLIMKNTDELAETGVINERLNDELSEHSANLELEVQKQTKQLREQASKDSLTQLYNRYKFEKELTYCYNEAKQKSKKHVMCYVDLDQFKLVNDTSGHVAGDELLKQLSSVLMARLEPNDMLARLGGDEFGFIFKNCSIEEARVRAQDVLDTIGAYRFIWKDKLFSVGASIGMVAITKECRSVEDLMISADSACYGAKESGRNRIQVFELLDMDFAKHKSDVEWIHEIERALDENRFELFGQPIVSLKEENRIEHFELLVRIRSREGKYFQPMAFIPAAERYNKIEAIDRWVIKEAFKLQRELLSQGKEIHFSINLSGTSLGNEDLDEYILEQFFETEIPYENICFEITETAAISHLNTALHFIKQFRELGCRFSLDDFGSGLSSFGYLKNIPVDYLKIDGQFIRDIDTNRINKEMVIAIDKIAKVMDIKTICEYVENEKVLNSLSALDIDYAQGYYFCIPKPILECIDLVCLSKNG